MDSKADWLDETTFDVIIVGTGFIQSVLAGVLAKADKTVLHLDKNEYYGGSYATFSLSSFTEHIGNKGYGHLDQLLEENRYFNIDLVPKLIYSSGDLVTTLIQSNVTHYLEFKCLEQSYLYVDGSIQEVPSSKEEIFKNKFLGLKDKRLLMKFINLCMDPNSPVIEEYKQKTFVNLLKSQNLPHTLEQFITYAIALVDSDQSSSNPNQPLLTTEEGLALIKDYVRSVGRYGNTPFLVPLYGTSELSQAYCRLCAVNQGVYVLRRSIDKLVINEETKFLEEVVCTAGQTLKTKFLITDFESLPQLKDKVSLQHRGLSRCVCVINKSISPSNLKNVLIIIPPNTPPFNNPSAIHILQFDRSLQVCPNNQYLIHISTPTTSLDGGSEAAEKALSPVVNHFFEPVPVSEETAPKSEVESESATKQETENQPTEKEKNESATPSPSSSSKPGVLWQAYYTQVLRHVNEETTQSTFEGLPSNVFVCSDATLGLGHAADLKEAKRIFSSICPDTEFLPSDPTEHLDEEVLREARLLQQQNEQANENN